MINPIALSLMSVSTFLAALGSVYFKRSTKNMSFNPIKMLQNKMIILAVFISVFAALVYVFALRFESLSRAYPATSLTYIWTIILSHYMLHEKITKNKIMAVFFIVVGILLISYT